MSHTRIRYGLTRILEKLNYSPVTSIQGARQVGKSYLAREIIPKKLKNAKYLTFDESAIKKFALSAPDTFLADNDESHPIIIDEAQKVPEIFDAVKLSVDNKKIPGRFLLLGSTEFSLEMNITESLMGRLSRAMLYPLTVSETLHLDPEYRILSLNNISSKRITRADFLRYLNRGGLPGIFTVTENSKRSELFNDWIQLLTSRDIFQFKKLKLDTDISNEILIALAKSENTDLDGVVKYTKLNTKVVSTHLKALKQLFVVNSLKPSLLGAGKERFFLFDSGVANHLGASFKRKMQITFLNEILAAIEYKGIFPVKVNTYVTARGSVIDFMLEYNKRKIAIKIFDKEDFDKRDFMVLTALKNKDPAVELYVLGAVDLKIDGIKQVEWEMAF